ncbi:hypothetical protein BaRGS_00003058, partial [Batillaria attramentaria]
DHLEPSALPAVPPRSLDQWRRRGGLRILDARVLAMKLQLLLLHGWIIAPSPDEGSGADNLLWRIVRSRDSCCRLSSSNSVNMIHGSDDGLGSGCPRWLGGIHTFLNSW